MKKFIFLLFTLFMIPLFCLHISAESEDNISVTLHLTFGNRSGIYTGETENGLPHGYGTFKSKTPDGIEWTHEGFFKEGHFDGIGTEIWANGKKETGNYKNDMLNGEGKRFSDGRLIYEGEWKDGTYHGFGKEYGENGEIYVGEYTEGIFTEGTYSVNDVIRAKGIWKNGYLWDGQTFDEEGEPFSTLEMGKTKRQYIVLVCLGIALTIPFIVIIFAAKIFKYIIKETARRKEELNKQKTFHWTCPSCGANNHGCDACEYCGKSKPKFY